MAGKAISSAYREKIEEVGIFKILERVESGETLGFIAKSLGMSRPFLSTFLNRDCVAAEALCIARSIAATRRIADSPKKGVGLGALKWLESVPPQHLAALGAKPQSESCIDSAVGTSSIDRLTAGLLARGIKVPTGASG